MNYQIIEIDEKSYEAWDDLYDLALSINRKNRNWLTRCPDGLISHHILVATIDSCPIGFIRFFLQRLGQNEITIPAAFNGKMLTEIKIETFGVTPQCRNAGIGRALQMEVISLAKKIGCYQVRSESPYEAVENYHLKISMGFGIQPRIKRQSVYFIKVL